MKSSICAAAAAVLCLMSSAVVASEPTGSDPLPTLVDYPDGPRPDRMPVIPKLEDGRGMFWSAKDMQDTFGGKIESHTAGAYAGNKEIIVFVTQRPPLSAHNADAEMHENMTQIYVILSGTATQFLGGTPAEAKPYKAGNFVARGALTGARQMRIGPGDMILIPPSTWHQTVADPGSTLTYNMINIMTPRAGSEQTAR